MSICYYKLFDYLNRNGMKKTDLIINAGISAPTLAKLSKGENINTDIIGRICEALKVQPADIMEYIPNRIEERNKAIIHNSLLWAKNQDCDTLYLLDVAVVAEYLFLNLPHCFYNFISTDKPGQVRASSAHKTIMKTLDKIQKLLLEKEAHLYDIL